MIADILVTLGAAAVLAVGFVVAVGILGCVIYLLARRAMMGGGRG